MSYIEMHFTAPPINSTAIRRKALSRATSACSFPAIVYDSEAVSTSTSSNILTPTNTSEVHFALPGSWDTEHDDNESLDSG